MSEGSDPDISQCCVVAVIEAHHGHIGRYIYTVLNKQLDQLIRHYIVLADDGAPAGEALRDEALKISDIFLLS